MADPGGSPIPVIPDLDQARAMARERFKNRLLAGEQVGGCECHDDSAASKPKSGPSARVAGVRFRDSGQTYWFRASNIELTPGDWVVVETSRGREAGRVVIAPDQMALQSLQGDLTEIVRKLGPADIERMESMKSASARAVKRCAAIAREMQLGIKIIVANYSFDGRLLTLNYSVPERDRRPDSHQLERFPRVIAAELGCRVELQQVGPRDEARLLGGLGRCGRTLCCASWLPVFPEISMNVAKPLDLPLNPAKVSGVCGRLLCCLSYENEQYKSMKAMMPRLGQPVETEMGPGIVIAMQLLKERVIVRLDTDGTELSLPVAELDRSDPVRREPAIAELVARPDPPRDMPPRPAPPALMAAADAPDQLPVSADEDADGETEAGAGGEGGRRRRRRRRSGKPRS